MEVEDVEEVEVRQPEPPVGKKLRAPECLLWGCGLPAGEEGAGGTGCGCPTGPASGDAGTVSG